MVIERGTRGLHCRRAGRQAGVPIYSEFRFPLDSKHDSVPRNVVVVAGIENGCEDDEDGIEFLK